MSTQIEEANLGIITDEMNKIAQIEHINPETIRKNVQEGSIVILKNSRRPNLLPTAIGKNLKVKVNANVGVVNNQTKLEDELDKVMIIQQAGADILMDLSICDLSDEVRQAILGTSNLPVGTVPIYQSARETFLNYGEIQKMTKEKIFEDIEKHITDGVDFVTLHAGLTKNILSQLKSEDELTGISTKGGEILSCWMEQNGCENIYYEYFDEILDLIKPYDVVLSLGSALRSRFASNRQNRIQMAEMSVISSLVSKARNKGIQVMVEGLGNMSLDKIETNVKMIKELTKNAPLYALSSLACDTTLGYDDLTSALGASFAATYGADLICATTSSSRIAIATNLQISQGVKIAKISAHCADLARGNEDIVKKNYNMAMAQLDGDWEKQIEFSYDKSVFRGIDLALDTKTCTICGKDCAINKK